MVGQFGPDTFTVLANDKSTVAAKYLKDANGDYVIDPLTQKPYIVPADYDPAAVLARFKQMGTTIGLEGVEGTQSIYDYFVEQFKQGGPSDLQRNYNGKHGSFVQDFANAASYNLGLAAYAAGLFMTTTEILGGLYNKFFGGKNTDGFFWNTRNDKLHQDNAASIESGYQAGRAGIYKASQADVYLIGTAGNDTQVGGGSVALPVSVVNPTVINNPNGSVTTQYPDGFVSTKTINANDSYIISTYRINGSTSSVTTYDQNGNVLNVSTRTTSDNGTYTISNSDASGSATNITYNSNDSSIVNESIINADKSSSNTSYFADHSVSSATITNADGSGSETVCIDGGGYASQKIINADGSTDTTNYWVAGVIQNNKIIHSDGAGSEVNYDLAGQKESSIVTNADGSYTKTIWPWGTLSNVINVNADGSYTSTNYMADGNVLSVNNVNADRSGSTRSYGYDINGVYTLAAMLSWNPDGSGSNTSYSLSGDGSYSTTTYNTSFSKTVSSNGDWQETTINGDGTSTTSGVTNGQSYGPYINGVPPPAPNPSITTDANGAVITTYRDHSGQIISVESSSAFGSDIKNYYPLGNLSSEVVKDNVYGSVTNTSYFVNGAISSESFTNADGSGRSVSYYAEGVASRISSINADGSSISTSYYVNGEPKTYTYSDASGASDIANYYINGNVSSSVTNFSNGSVTKASYDINGKVLSDSWSNINGSFGSDNADGSSSGSIYLTDGSHYNYANDGHGDITTANYTASNIKSSDSWVKANGTVGADVFSTDGSSTSTIYAANGSIASQNVTFAQGVVPADLQLSWGQTIGAISGLVTDPQLNYTVLNLSWGTNQQSIQVMIPHSDDPVGSGVSQFTFADGTTLSMPQMIAMAPPAPTFDPQIFVAQLGMGSQVLGAGFSSIHFGAGITSNMITLGLGSLMLRVGTNGDVIHISNFDPSNALAPNTIQNFSFTDGLTLTYDQLLAKGFDIYGTTGNETLSGTNLVNRIYAGSGNDTLIGTGTSDTLVAGTGLDTLIGGKGNETFVINNTKDVVVADASATSNSIISSVSYALPDNVQSLILTGSDNLTAIGNQLNNVITANGGNDILIGGSSNDTLVAGSGNDQIYAGSGATTIQIDPMTAGTDLIGGSGSIDSAQLLNSIYRSMGIKDWQANYQYANMYYLPVLHEAFSNPQDAFNAIYNHANGDIGYTEITGAIASGDAVYYSPLPVFVEISDSAIQSYGLTPASYYATSNTPALNLSANDFQALAPYFADGVLQQHTVTFGQGVLPVDLHLSWGQTLGSITGKTTDPQLYYTTLNISWGTNNQSIQVMIPHSNDPLGSGASQFTFADGTTLSMAQMIAMAPAAPTFDPQIFQYQPGMGVQHLGAGYTGISFGPGITSSQITLGLGSLMLRIGNSGDVIHIENFDPSNALAANSIQRFNFADGSSLTYDQLLARGFDIYGTTGNETLSGTNLDNRIYAGSGNDVLIGTGANDTLVAGAGVDTMIGGTGNETFVINNAADVIVANTNAASNSVVSSVSYAMQDNVQKLTLTGSDNLTGTGNGLNDIITGNAGNDTLIAGSGNDTLVAGSGVATLIGGSGNNTFVINNAADVIVLDPNAASNSVVSSISYVMPDHVQNLTLAGSGNLTATGNSLNDVITGNAGNDTLIAGSGNDTLVSGTGGGTMIGGTGSDTFVLNLSSGQQTIIDSLKSSSDVIQFGAGITAGDVQFMLNGNDLIVTYGKHGDSVLVQGFAPNGATGAQSIGQFMFADGSQGAYYNDGQGNAYLDAYDASGNLKGDFWQISDGTYGNDTFNANGTSIGSAYNRDGSYSSYVKDGQGNATTMNFDATGIKVSDTWAKSNRAHGSDTFNADGSSSGTSYNAWGGYSIYSNDGHGSTIVTNYDSSNTKLSDGWTKADGSSGNDVFNWDGSYTAIINDGYGDFTTTNFDASGVRLSDSWTKTDGSYGSDTYNADGSSNGASYNTDGSYSLSSNDGLGNISVNNFDASGTLVGDSGQNSDGSSYMDTYYADGSASGSTHNADGSYYTYTQDPQGNYAELDYNASGVKISDYFSHPDGSWSEDYFNADGSSYGDTHNADSSHSSYTNDGHGSVKTDYFDASGNLLGYSIAVSDGLGDITTTSYDASGNVTGQSTTGSNTDTILTPVSYSLANQSRNSHNLTGTGTADITLTGNNLNNVITANSGNDTLVAGAGVATLIGGTGNDTFVVNNVNDVVQAQSTGSNINTVLTSVSYTASANIQNLTGTGSSDITLTGNDLNNVITANSGNDTLVAGAGVATLIGGTGNDTFVVNNVNDVVQAQSSGSNTNTVLTSVSYVAPANVQNLTGTGTADLTLTGNGLIDTITANSGNDTLIAGSGVATMVGGSGNDTFIVNNSADVVLAQANAGINTVQSSVDFSMDSNARNVQNLTLTADNISGTGNALNNNLVALGANDTLIAGSGVATMTGSGRNDTFVVNNVNDIVIEQPNQGNNTVLTSVSYVAPANVQNLTGTGTADLTLTGNNLNNVITANSGNDTLIAGSGVATLIGGIGNDTFVVNNVNNVVQAQSSGSNINTVLTSVSYVAPANVQNLTGTGTTDLTLTGNNLNNVITANSGNDTLVAGSGLATMVGGTGNDLFIVNNSADTVEAQLTGGNTNTVESSVNYSLADQARNVQNLTGIGSANITLTGNSLNNVITANGGNDTLVAGSGVATLVGGTGSDTFVVNNVNDVVQAQSSGSNINTVLTSVSYAAPANVQNLTGTGTADLTLTGNNLNNVITANSGNDTLIVGSGVATLIGGTGNDTFVVNNVNDVVQAQSSGSNINTVLTSVSYVAPANVQNLTGTGTADLTLTGNDLNNVITANNGNDTLIAGSGVATMIGGTGNDTFVVNNVNDVVQAQSTGNNINTVLTSVSYVAPANVQNLTGTGSADITLTGNNLNNVITANSGNDTLIAGSGVATLIGGVGSDTFIVNNVNDVVQAQSSGSNINTVLTSVNYVAPVNVQNLTGLGSADLLLTGNSLDNIITANSGNDTLTGAGGNDTFVGGAGNDLMIGGTGNDTYVYNQGNGLDNLVDTGGTNTVRLGAGLSFQNVVVRLTYADGTPYTVYANGNGEGDHSGGEGDHSGGEDHRDEDSHQKSTNLIAHMMVLDSNGVEQASQGMDFAVTVDNHGNFASPIQSFQFSDGSSQTFGNMLVKTETIDAEDIRGPVITGRNDAVVYAGRHNTGIWLGTGNDTVYASERGSLVYAGGGNDYLVGSHGNDTFVGGWGVDVLQGGEGNDVLSDLHGRGALLGGEGNDTITAGSGNDFIAGGRGNDLISTGATHNVIAFNKGDGRDTILATPGASNTLSLGGEIDYRDLSFSKSGNDLVLNEGRESSVTFKDWYASSANHDFVTLQIIGQQSGEEDRHQSHDAASASKVNEFDFSKLVAMFDQAIASKPSLNQWSLMDGLLNAHLASSDTAALGGDLAYVYGTHGSLSGMGLSAVQNTLKDQQFGTSAQTLHSWPTLNSGTAQIR